MTDQETAEVEAQGAFMSSLTRNNSKIKRDRAEALFETTEMLYRRRVEDIQIQIKQLERKRESALDLSPDNTQSLKPANDFDADAFVSDDIAYTLELRNLNIRLTEAQERYAHLFGRKVGA